MNNTLKTILERAAALKPTDKDFKHWTLPADEAPVDPTDTDQQKKPASLAGDEASSSNKPAPPAEKKKTDADPKAGLPGERPPEVKGNKTLSGQPANVIEINPMIHPLKEQVGGTAVITFGRMNPPTIGHAKLVSKIISIAHQIAGTPMVFLSKTTDKTKNPIPYMNKLAYAKTAFGDVVKSVDGSTFFDAIKMANRAHRHLVVVVGSDRVDELKTQIVKYNGREYNFETIQVMSAGERDPDGDGVEGMSASKMRQLAKSDQFEKFKAGLPPKLREVAQSIYRDVRLHEGCITDQEELTEALNVQQRLKRAVAMRRIKNRIATGRKRALKRRAPRDVITKRSRRLAIRFMKARLLRGRKYSDLPYGVRAQIDARILKRKKAIDRLASKLQPRVQRAESNRKLGSNFASVSVTGSKPEPAAKKADVREEFELLNIVRMAIDEQSSYSLTESEKAAIRSKSLRSGIDEGVLEEVYRRGVIDWIDESDTTLNHSQFAFNRLNSFISGGKAIIRDSDLVISELADLKPRYAMPQLPDFEAFTKDLEDSGHSHKLEVVKPDSLKPTQKHFNDDKINKLIDDKAWNKKPIIISKDDHVIDGHHRWAAAQRLQKPIKARRVSMKHDELLDFCKGKDYVQQKKLSESKTKAKYEIDDKGTI